jgi:hypothetical protein
MRNSSLFRQGRSCPWNAADAASKAVFQLNSTKIQKRLLPIREYYYTPSDVYNTN